MDVLGNDPIKKLLAPKWFLRGRKEVSTHHPELGTHHTQGLTGKPQASFLSCHDEYRAPLLRMTLYNREGMGCCPECSAQKTL